MSARNGKPCKRCGGNRWGKWGCLDCLVIRSRKFREGNPEYGAQKIKELRKANPDKYKEINKTWASNNPEKVAAYQKKHRETNKEKHIAYLHTKRTDKTGGGGVYTASQWKRLCEQYGGRCCYPGCDRTDLEPDHIKPVSKGGSSDINNIQPLCSYHNRSKGSKEIDYR